MVIVAAMVVALVILLFPPWRARAVRTTIRYAAVREVAASTLVDTLSWTLPFAPMYSPPRAPLSGPQMQELATRSAAGDTVARAELRSTADVETRLHVPEVLRTAGSIWRDSVLKRAGIPSVTSYELTFMIDQRWVAGRLIVLAAIAVLLARRR